MGEEQSELSTIFHLDIYGIKFTTTIYTLTQWDSNSMLVAMYSDRYSICKDPQKSEGMGIFVWMLCIKQC